MNWKIHLKKQGYVFTLTDFKKWCFIPYISICVKVEFLNKLIS